MKGLRATAINSDSIDAFAKAFRASLQKNLPPSFEEKRNFVRAKFTAAYDWYHRVIGTRELQQHQDRVGELQEQLLQAQEARRVIGAELNDVRRKSNEVQEQLHKVKRQENLQLFLDLMRTETELLKREQEITVSFQSQDKLEREIFSAFTNAIRTAHEKQRTQLEYTKYWGLLLSCVGTFLSFVYTRMRNEDMRRVIATNMNDGFAPVVERIERSELYVRNSIDQMRRDGHKAIESHRRRDAAISEKDLDRIRIALRRGDQHEEPNQGATLIKYALGGLAALIIMRAISG